ncbi:MAG: molybdopterin synthase catalytic subunit MoaE [Halioglobus sp.]
MSKAQLPTNSASIWVSIQEDDFDVAALQSRLLSEAHSEGAVATFTGYVRNENDQRDVATLRLEHYPGMTERSIETIMHEAAQRWPLIAVATVHRVGELRPGDQIVWVGVSSSHREAAFAATEFIMDYLKTQAPFWKKEIGSQGERWVQSRTSDQERAERW